MLGLEPTFCMQLLVMSWHQSRGAYVTHNVVKSRDLAGGATELYQELQYFHIAPCRDNYVPLIFQLKLNTEREFGTGVLA